MSNGIVASLRGDWLEVTRAIQVVFAGGSFTLLAEDDDPFAPYHFTPDPVKQARILDSAHGLPCGRAFDARRELRWRKSPDGDYAISYLSEETDEPPAAINWKRVSRHWEVAAQSQKLYGKKNREETDWVEVSVPGASGVYAALLDADTRPDSLKLDVVDYAINGVTQMTRFCAVSAYQPS